MELDNEENYFTKRMNGAIKDENVEKAENELRKYIYKDIPFMSKKIESDFDKFCYNHCKCIETILNELKYREQKLKDLKFRLDCKEKIHNYDVDMIDEVKGEVVKLNKEIEKKDKIIDLMAEHIEKGCDFDNKIQTKQQILDYFTKKAEE